MGVYCSFTNTKQKSTKASFTDNNMIFDAFLRISLCISADLDGISITKDLIQKQPDFKVIILSMHLEENYIKQSLRAGAKRYILKYSPH